MAWLEGLSMPGISAILERAFLNDLLSGVSMAIGTQCAVLDERGRVVMLADMSSGWDALPFDVSRALLKAGLIDEAVHTKWRRTFAAMLARSSISRRPQRAESSGAGLRFFQCAAPIVAGNECVGVLVSGKVPLAPATSLEKVATALARPARSASDRELGARLCSIGALARERIAIRLAIVGKAAACASRVATQALRERDRERQTLRERDRERLHVRALAKVVQAINRGQREDEILNVIVDQGFKLVSADHGTIHIWDPGQGKLLWRAQRTPPGVQTRVKVGSASPPPGKGIVGWVFRTNRPALIHDLKRQPQWRKRYWGGFKGIRSELAVPLRSSSGVLGVLNVESCRPNAFTEEHRGVLMTLAEHAVVALQKADLFRTKTRQLEAFAIAASSLGAPHPLDEQLMSIVRQAVRAVEGSVGSMKLYDDRYLGDRRGALHFVAASRSDGMDMARVGKRFRRKSFRVFVPEGSKQDSVSAWVYRHRNGKITADTRREPLWRRPPWPAGSGIHVPMLIHNRPVGILGVDSPKVRAFTDDDLDVLQRLANQAAVGVEKAWHDELVVRVRRILPEVMSIAPSETPSEHAAKLLAKLASIVWDVMKPRACTIIVPEENGSGRLIVPDGCEYGIVRHRPLRLWAGQGLAGQAIKTGNIQKANNVQADRRFGEKRLAAQHGLVSALSLPIVARDGRIGALNYYTGFERSFSEFETHALQTICGIAGMAIAAAQTERHRAESILDAIGTGVTLVGIPLDWRERLRRYKKGDPDWNLNLEMRLLYINQMHRQYAPQATVGDICYKAFNTPRQDRPCWWCPTVRAMFSGNAHVCFTHSPAPPKERVEHFKVTATILKEQARPVAAIESAVRVTGELEGGHLSARLVELADEEEVFRLGAECLGRGYHADRIACADLVDSRILSVNRVYTVDRKVEAYERKAWSPWCPDTPTTPPPVGTYFAQREQRGHWLFRKRPNHPDAGRQMPADTVEAILASIKKNHGVAVLEETAIPDSLRRMTLFSNAQKATLVGLGTREDPWGCVVLVHEKPPTRAPAFTVAIDPIERASELHWCAEVCNELTSKIESLRFSRSLQHLAAFRKVLIEEAPVGVVTIDRDGVVTSANRAWRDMAGGDPTARNVFEFESIRRAGLVGKLRAALRGKGFELLGRRFRSEWGRELVLSARCVPLRERGQVREVLISCWDMSAIAAEYDNLMKRTEKVTLGRLAAGAVHEIMSPAKAAEYASQEIARGLTNLIAAERHILVTRLSKETVDLLRDAANAVLPWLARGAPPLPLPQDAEIEKTTSLLAQPGLRLNRPEASVLTRAGLSAHVHRLLAVCRTRVARQRLIAYLVNLARIAHATNVMVHSLPRIQRLAKALEAHAFVESAEWQLAELHQTIDAAIVILHPDLQQVDTDLERRYSSRLGKVKCVPGQLIQMWRNLVGNSLNAIRKSRRRGHIRVTTRRRGNAAFVTIRDNGIGIPPEVEVKAMGTSLPDIAGGKTAGYGLWIVREILERHGGRLCVRRLPGGASITVLLPAEEQSART